MPSAQTKKTPAIRRAERKVDQALEELRDCDLVRLQAELEALALDAMPKSALLTVVENLHRLAQAEALRDKGGKQHDMFAHLTQEEFATTQHRMDQPALF